ncbi:retroviral-like aspartic protease family protein [Sphingomonas sp.]|uniref:retroviral-like aspartic protease family protein n=1 Tax=Sphingomonas sp. TaxID=28214 RepID=UPI0035C7DB42
MSIVLAILAAAQPVGAPAGEATATPPTIVAFGDEGTRMTVPVSIAAAGPFRFVVDTGAERTVVSRELASTLGLAAGRTIRVTAMADTAEVGTVLIPSIRVGRIGGARIEAPAFQEQHLGAPGMLGIDTLQGHALTIDFDKAEMSVVPSDRRRRRAPAGSPDEIVVRARSLYGQLVVTDAYYAGTRVKVILDTGSAVTLGNPALRARVARNRKPMKPISLLSVTGTYLNADYTQVRRMKLGDIELADVPVAFADALPFRRFGLTDQPALLLGMDTLKLFRRVKIDFAKREIRFLLPRTALRDMRNPWSIAR